MKVNNYMTLWWLIEGRGGCGTGVENAVGKTDKEMEEHFFEMKRVYDKFYLEFDEKNEYNIYAPKRNIYYSKSGCKYYFGRELLEGQLPCKFSLLYMR